MKNFNIFEYIRPTEASSEVLSRLRAMVEEINMEISRREMELIDENNSLVDRINELISSPSNQDKVIKLQNAVNELVQYISGQSKDIVDAKNEIRLYIIQKNELELKVHDLQQKIEFFKKEQESSRMKMKEIDSEIMKKRKKNSFKDDNKTLKLLLEEMWLLKESINNLKRKFEEVINIFIEISKPTTNSQLNDNFMQINKNSNKITKEALERILMWLDDERIEDCLDFIVKNRFGVEENLIKKFKIDLEETEKVKRLRSENKELIESLEKQKQLILKYKRIKDEFIKLKSIEKQSKNEN